MSSSSAVAARAEAVDLVDEDEQRQPGGAHGSREAARLRLHALDGRDHQHDAIQHAQRTLDLSDEVTVSGGVDQIDFEVAELERDHGGLDGDAADAFQFQRVGLRRALVDPADRLDDAGFVEDAFGEAGFTGVYMRQHPEIDNRHARHFR